MSTAVNLTALPTEPQPAGPAAGTEWCRRAEIHRVCSPFLAASAYWRDAPVRSDRRRFPAGTFVYREGESADRFYWVRSGRAKVVKATRDGTDKVLAVAEQGAVFGVADCFDELGHASSAVADSTLDVLTFARADVLAAMTVRPDVIAHVLRDIARSNRVLAAQSTMAGLPGSQRVALLLGQLTAHARRGRPDRGGIRFRQSQDELASMLGVSRSTVVRELDRLVRRGIIAKDRWDIVVLDPVTLDRLAGVL